jgi:hypothetical protein
MEGIRFSSRALLQQRREISIVRRRGAEEARHINLTFVGLATL